MITSNLSSRLLGYLGHREEAWRTQTHFRSYPALEPWWFLWTRQRYTFLNRRCHTLQETYPVSDGNSVAGLEKTASYRSLSWKQAYSLRFHNIIFFKDPAALLGFECADHGLWNECAVQMCINKYLLHPPCFWTREAVPGMRLCLIGLDLGLLHHFRP